MVPTDPLRQHRQAATSGFPKAALETLLGASVRVYLQDIESPTPCPSPQPTSALLKTEISTLHSRAYSVSPTNRRVVEPTFQNYLQILRSFLSSTNMQSKYDRKKKSPHFVIYLTLLGVS